MNVHIAIPIEDGMCLACLLDYGGVIWLLDDALITVSNNAPCAAAHTSESGVNAKRSILTLVIADSSLVLRRFTASLLLRPSLCSGSLQWLTKGCLNIG